MLVCCFLYMQYPWNDFIILAQLIIITAASFQAVSGKWRQIIPVLYQLPFGLGNAVMALLAYWLRDWRKLEFGLASLSSLYILYWLWIPESPRWLIATGQRDKAVGMCSCLHVPKLFTQIGPRFHKNSKIPTWLLSKMPARDYTKWFYECV